jgi:hypothetical protein
MSLAATSLCQRIVSKHWPCSYESLYTIKPPGPPPSLTAVTELSPRRIPPMAFYPTEPNSRDILPMLRDLLSKHPEYRHNEPYELQSVLWSLRYTDELLDEDEIAAAAEVARTDSDPDEAA